MCRVDGDRPSYLLLLLIKKLQHNFPKMRGGGQRLFGIFPKIHLFWKPDPSLSVSSSAHYSSWPLSTTPVHCKAIQRFIYDSKGLIPSYAPFQIRICFYSYVVCKYLFKGIFEHQHALPTLTIPTPPRSPFIRKLFMLSHLMLLRGLQRQKHRVIIPHIVSPAFDVLFRTGGRGSTVIYQRLGTQSVQGRCRLVVVAAKKQGMIYF